MFRSAALPLLISAAVVGSGARLTPRVVSSFASSPPSPPSPPSFAGAHSYPTGPHPLPVAIADLNGDGKPDLATANSGKGANTLSILLNRGDGSYGPKRDYATGRRPATVAIGDLNSDGNPDLATANVDAGTVSVLLNKGDGSLQAKLDYRAGNASLSVAIGDLNGDVKPDLAVARSVAGGAVSVLLNRGDGTFRAKLDYPTGTYAEAVAIGDLNGDAKPDLAVPNLGEGAVSVLLNKGDGTFRVKRDYDAGNEPLSVAIGDLNGDGKPDLAVSNDGGNYSPEFQPAGSVSVLLNRGDGTFRTQRVYPTGSVSPPSVAIGDLNGDGKPDLVTANSDGSGTVSVLLNKGGGSVQAALFYPIGRVRRFHRSVAIGDLNGDDRPDLATVAFGKTVSVLLAKPAVVCAVPNVTGTTRARAERTIASAHCRVGKIGRAYSNRVKKGRVIWENPEPRTVLPNRGKVNIVVSLGKR